MSVNLVPAEILEILDNYYEDYCFFRFIKADFTPGKNVIDLEIYVKDYDGSNPVQQKWAIEIVGYRSGSIFFNECSWLNVVTDHPLLWQFTKRGCSLYFNGQSANPAMLFADLYHVHEAIFEGYLPFETFFNKTGNLLQLISSGHGLLAAGPEDLLIRYADSLVQHGIRYSFLSRKDATRDVLVKPALKTLLLGESYIIAEDFIFIQLD